MKTLLLMVLTATLLTACGGGGGSSSDDSGAGSPNNPPPTTNPPPPPSEPVSGSAFLAWVIPTEREDGDPLAATDVGGYEINYRLVGESQFTAIVVEDGSVNEYVLEDLDAGRYEIFIHAFDNDGMYSVPSQTVFANI